VWDGSTYVIVYVIGAPTRFGSQMTIMAARVSADGDMQTPHLPLSPTGSYFAPSIAVSPSGSLVVWTDTKFGAIDGALLSRASSVTPLAFPDVSGAFFSTAAAWNGENFLVASPLTSDEIRWFLVSDTGQVTSPPTPAWVPWKRPALTFFAAIEVQAAGDGFLLTFLNEGVIYAAAIDRAGTIEHARVVVARPAPRETSFGMSGTTIVYARQTDPLRDRLSRVFMRELQIVPDPPRRRAVR